MSDSHETHTDSNLAYPPRISKRERDRLLGLSSREVQSVLRFDPHTFSSTVNETGSLMLFSSAYQAAKAGGSLSPEEIEKVREMCSRLQQEEDRMRISPLASVGVEFESGEFKPRLRTLLGNVGVPIGVDHVYTDLGEFRSKPSFSPQIQTLKLLNISNLDILPDVMKGPHREIPTGLHISFVPKWPELQREDIVDAYQTTHRPLRNARVALNDIYTACGYGSPLRLAARKTYFASGIKSSSVIDPGFNLADQHNDGDRQFGAIRYEVRTAGVENLYLVSDAIYNMQSVATAFFAHALSLTGRDLPQGQEQTIQGLNTLWTEFEDDSTRELLSFRRKYRLSRNFADEGRDRIVQVLQNHPEESARFRELLNMHAERVRRYVQSLGY